MLARSVTCPLHKRVATKIDLRVWHIPLIQEEPSCYLLAKECVLNTGKLHLGGLPRNSWAK